MYNRPDKNEIIKIGETLKINLSEEDIAGIMLNIDRIEAKLNKIDNINTDGIEPLEFFSIASNLRDDDIISENYVIQEKNYKIKK
jgi:Asp-tRNA(Asn)/Glu-tRNA(Gln) amidotransferase C subunit